MISFNFRKRSVVKGLAVVTGVHSCLVTNVVCAVITDKLRKHVKVVQDPSCFNEFQFLKSRGNFLSSQTFFLCTTERQPLFIQQFHRPSTNHCFHPRPRHVL